LVILGALAANCPANFGEISEMFQIIEGWQNIRILNVFCLPFANAFKSGLVQLEGGRGRK
jgi:hypothetical protein